MHRLRWTGTASREEFEAAIGNQGLWYHSYYFDNDYEVRGEYNIGIDLADYGFPSDMTG